MSGVDAPAGPISELSSRGAGWLWRSATVQDGFTTGQGGSSSRDVIGRASGAPGADRSELTPARITVRRVRGMQGQRMRSRTRPSRSLLVIAFLLALLPLTVPALAGIVIPMDDDDLIRGADAIVLGRITQIESHRDAFGPIHTYVTVSLDEILKGDLRGRSITIREIGGRVGDRSYWAFANPEFVVGEPVLLFMDQRSDGTLRTYQFYLGKFTVVTDPATGDLAAVRGVPPRVTTLSRPSAVAVPAGDVARRLDDFKLQIYQRAGEAPPQTVRPRPLVPVASATVPASGTSEVRGEFRFIGDPDPPSPVNPTMTLVRWIEADSNLPVTMRINSTGEPAAPTLGFSQIRAAMKSWSRVPTSSFRFAEGPPTTAGGFQGQDGVNAISFRDPLHEIPDPVNCSGILAVAGISLASGQTTSVNGRTFNRALQGDLVVNNGWENCFGIFYQDVENFTEVMTHELGHVLGLGHSDVSTVDPVSGDDGATMEPIAHFDGRAAVLHADDKAGATFIYPAHTLTIRKSGAGSGTVTSATDGISCGSECVAGFAVNSAVALTATPSPGSTFSGFLEAGCGTTVVMSTDRTCTAQFITQPDLVISAIAAPPVAAPGSTITVNNTVRNTGLASGAFTVGLYLSNGSAVTILDRRLATRRIAGGLATNATSADATAVVIPADVALGHYVIGAIADIDNEVSEAAGESNNAASTPIVVGKSDLVVTALSAPTTAGAGRTITVSSTVKNQATTAVTAPPSTLAFYLSTDAVAGGDVRLGETRAIPSLAKDATSVGSTTLTIPASTQGGSYFLIAVADDLHVVDESDETNNTRATATTIAISRPDLSVTSVTATPLFTAPGMNVSVTLVVRNVASAPASAPASTSRLFLSSNTILGDRDDVDLGTVPVGALDAGAQASLLKTVQIPAGTQPGQYWIFARANDGGSVPEGTGANNTAHTAVPITIGADLRVTLATVTPTATAPGMTVNVTNSVKNQGGPTTAAFDVGIYLSSNATFESGSDVRLATRRVVGGLTAGATSGPVVTPVVIPANTSAGTYFLLVRADAGGSAPTGEVLESDETNNVLATTAILVAQADLAVQSVTAPTVASAGANVSVSHVVKNLAAAAGTAAASTSRLYLSTNPVLDVPGDTVLGDVAVGPLAGGAMATVAKVVQIPGGTASGVYWIIAQANATSAVPEVDAPTRANNVKATVVPIVIGPDLVVAAAVATPATVAPGMAVSVSSTVKNQGGAATGAFDIGIYLSTNGTFDAADPRLATRRVTGLAAAAVSTAATPVTIPSNVSAGTYFLIVRADVTGGGAQEIVEASEANNALATAAIEVVQPDLAVQSVTATAVSRPGMNVSVTHVVKNLAAPAGRAAASTSRLYLSSDTVLDVPGDPVLGDVTVAPLAGGGTVTVTGTVQIPPATAPGLYWVIAKANATSSVPEADSPALANNVKATATPIIVGPDLVVTAAAATPVSVAPGSAVSVTNTIKNQGGAPAGAFDVGIYLSTNPTVEPGADIQLASRRVSGLLPAAVSTAVTPVIIPSNASAGTYFLVVRADITGGAPQEVAEANEANNVLASAPIQVVQPDLTVLTVTAPAATAAGMNVSVSHVVKNLAPAAGRAGASLSRLYLSSNPTLDVMTDVALGDVAVGALAGGVSASIARIVQIPPATTPGLYWIIAQANVDNTVREVASPGQTNNAGTAAAPMIVGPDLLVTAATVAPLTTAPGLNVSVISTVKNQGGAPAGAFDVGIYLSTNTSLDLGTDVLLASRRVTGLPPAAASTATTVVTIPSNYSAGTYFVVVRADITGAVPQEVAEANETNNALASAALAVAQADLSLQTLTATPAALPAGGNVSVTLTIKNIAPAIAVAATTTARLYVVDVPVPTMATSAPVLGDVTVPPLAGGAVTSVTRSFALPPGTRPGTYWIFATANAVNPIAEGGPSDQANNLQRTATPLIVGADLTLTALTVPAEISPGGTLSVVTTVKNKGGQTADASVVRFFLSGSDTLDGSEIPVGSTTIAALPAGASRATTTQITIPGDTSVGTRFLVALADGDHQIEEADETNNLLSRGFSVVGSPPAGAGRMASGD